jgi:hypothetical protein
MRDIYNTGADLDAHLEKVMESHGTASVKEAATPETESGLQAYVERRSIAEEIAQLGNKTASVDLREEIARDKISGIMVERQSLLSSFHETVKSAAAEITAVTPEKVAADLIRQGMDPQEAARRALA